MNEEKKYYIRNQETWELEEVTKEIYDNLKAWRAAIPKPKDKDGKLIGKIMLFGTGGGDDNIKGLKDMFHHSDNYHIIKYKPLDE